MSEEPSPSVDMEWLSLMSMATETELGGSPESSCASSSSAPTTKQQQTTLEHWRKGIQHIQPESTEGKEDEPQSQEWTSVQVEQVKTNICTVVMEKTETQILAQKPVNANPLTATHNYFLPFFHSTNSETVIRTSNTENDSPRKNQGVENQECGIRPTNQTPQDVHSNP